MVARVQSLSSQSDDSQGLRVIPVSPLLAAAWFTPLSTSGMCQALLDTGLGEMRCVGDLHRQHLWGSLTDGAPGIKGPLRG